MYLFTAPLAIRQDLKERMVVEAMNIVFPPERMMVRVEVNISSTLFFLISAQKFSN
jgi:hypothetical protein